MIEARFFGSYLKKLLLAPQNDIHLLVHRQEPSQHIHPGVREETFGMELHAVERFAAMFDGHDLAISIGGIAPGGHSEHFGERVGLDDQAVITGRLKWIHDSIEQRAVVVMNLIDFAVHQAPRADDLAAERLADGLMAQAYSQDRQLAGELADAFHRDAGFGRGTRSGRDDQPVGLTGEDLVDRDLIVAVDADIERGIDFPQPLHEVVGERVVVVDDLDHVCILIGERGLEDGGERLGAGGLGVGTMDCWTRGREIYGQSSLGIVRMCENSGPYSKKSSYRSGQR